MELIKKRGLFSLILLTTAFVGLLSFAIFFNGFDAVSVLILFGIFLAGVGVWFIPKKVFLPIAAAIAVLAPAGFFLLGESYTHVVWDTMEWDAVGLNLVFYIS